MSMNINISMSEILVICGTTIGVFGHVIGMWILISMGILGGIIRYTMTQNDKKEAQEKLDNSVDNFKKSAADFVGLFNAGTSNDTIN